MEKVQKAQRTALQAFAAAKEKFLVPKQTGMNTHLHKPYSTLDDILAAVEPALTEEGLILRMVPDLGRVEFSVVLVATGEELHLGTYPAEWKSADGMTIAQAYGWAFRIVGRILGLRGVKDDGEQSEAALNF